MSAYALSALLLKTSPDALPKFRRDHYLRILFSKLKILHFTLLVRQCSSQAAPTFSGNTPTALRAEDPVRESQDAQNAVNNARDIFLPF